MKLFPIILLGLFSGNLIAQQGAPKELVRNGGFEVLDKPVVTYDQLPYASGWSNSNLGLCDVFVPSASPKSVGVPTNDYGTMKPFEGENYGGFFGWKDDVRRNFGSSDPSEVFKPGWNFYSEYPQVELIEPLKEDMEYEVVFHVALSGNSDRAIQGIAAYPAIEKVLSNHRKFLEVFPEIEFEPLINEKEKWTEVRGRFKADGGEQFLVIGVFPFMGLVSESIIEGNDNQYAYFYLDGVSLKEAPEEVESE
ncbi:MAG: hypothetical protein WEC15_07295 [Flavobacteriales bacterium]